MSYTASCTKCERIHYRVNNIDFLCPVCGEVITMMLRPIELCLGSTRPIRADDEGLVGDPIDD